MKNIKVRRLSLFFLLFCFILTIPAIGQNKENITLIGDNISIKEAFTVIEKQCGYTLNYNSSQINTNKKISLDLINVTLKDAIDSILEKSNFTYKIIGKSIILVLKEDKNVVKQKKLINGIVTDIQDEPLIGVNVLVEGRPGIGCITDIEGKFNLNVNEDDSLNISYLGFLSQIVPVGKKTNIKIVLQEDRKLLDEVVVVGYGVQKKVNLTGAVSGIDADEIKDRPITNSTQALQGVQGVYVNQAGAQPGADGATIRVRGQGTMNDNNPLVLVNGIEYSLDAVNPNDIESITVLKDAASSAIYGARAANGVILVKVKEGTTGKFKVNYNNYFGVQEATYLPNFVYDPILFMRTRNQAQLNQGNLRVDYSDELITEYEKGMKEDPIMYPKNNWLDIMYKKAIVQEHNLSFTGGTDKLLYALSLGYTNQEGVLRGTDAEKYSVSLNTTAKITDNFKLNAYISGNCNSYDEPVAGVANLVEMTYKAQAFHPKYTKEGLYADTFIRTPGHNIYRHPLALADEGENHHRNIRLLCNLGVDYNLPFDILYKFNIGINKSDGLQSLFAPEVYTNNLKTGAKKKVVFDGQNIRHAYRKDVNNLSKTLYHTLSWAHSFNSTHNLTILLGNSYQHDSFKHFSASREGFLDNELKEISAGSINPSAAGTAYEVALLSYFGRINYNYKERYLFEANFRYDGSSRFAKGNKWGVFPSFSAGWRISEEDFMKNVSWLDNLKLRMSWGQLGNERIDLFRYVDVLDLNQTYPLNGEIFPGAAVTSYNDPNITWETTEMLNLGVDMVALNGRFEFSTELFDKRTKDILRTVTLPSQVGGLRGPIRNIGEVSNKGIEFNISYRDNIGNFDYGVNANLTYIKNKIESLGGQTIVNDNFILKEGHPIDSYYMLHAIGIFQTQEEIDNSPFQTSNTKPGYLKFEDVNKDGKITEEDRKIIGGVVPKYTYGFNINLGYKGWHLDAFFQGVHDVHTYGDRIGATPLWFGCGLPKKWTTDAWTPEKGSSATLPIITTYEGGLNENFRKNDFWLRDASYLRLKNMQLSYSFPYKWINSIGIDELKLFVNAQNLFTISHMHDFDPEKELKGATFYAYPSVRTFSLGVNLKF